jgi:hypothetical protein
MVEDSAESWKIKGDGLFQLKKYEEALDCYLNATDINPEYAPAWHQMGLICQILGQQEESDICFKKERDAIQKANLERLRKIASSVKKEDHIPEKLEISKQDNPHELYLKGISLSQNNQLDEALSIFEQVTILDPTNYKAWNSKGVALAKLQRYQEANIAFNQALTINPSYQPSIDNLKRVQNIKSISEPPKKVEQFNGSTKQPEVLNPNLKVAQTKKEDKTNFCLNCGAELPFKPGEWPTGLSQTCPSCGVNVKNPTRWGWNKGTTHSGGIKNPGLSALLSFFIPGLGQAYNGNVYRGVIFLIGTLIGLVLLVVPGIIVFIYGIYDAYSTAKKINAGDVPFKRTNIMILITFAIVGILFAIILTAAIATVLFGISGYTNSSKLSPENNLPIYSPIPPPSTLSINQIKYSAKIIPYDDLFRYNEQYIGEYVYFRGQILQTQLQYGDNYILRVGTKKSDYSTSFYDEIIWVNYKGPRVLENDIIDIWGKVKGLKEYTAVLGNTITIPEIDAIQLEVLNKGSPTSGSLSTNPDSTANTYVNNKFGFSLNYPRNWIKKEFPTEYRYGLDESHGTIDKIQFTSPPLQNENDILEILIFHNYPQITLEDFFTSHFANAMNIDVTYRSPQYKLSDNYAYRIDYNTEDYNGRIDKKYTQIFTIFNNDRYIITYSGKPDVYDNYMTTALSIFDSFKYA